MLIEIAVAYGQGHLFDSTGDFGEIAKKEQSAYIKSSLRAGLLGECLRCSRDCYFL